MLSGRKQLQIDQFYSERTDGCGGGRYGDSYKNCYDNDSEDDESWNRLQLWIMRAIFSWQWWELWKVYDIETIVSLNAQAEGLSGVCVCGRNDGEWKKNTEWPMNE